ncbi:unnamed protein product [Trypanosoma congolense IL3000]|uniref:WGS project CAEQ00000000 data, annotated contig 1698 n=1 Tax=Trypanosoma congolense (strain IL3000) TaxID=1068625 RepID=F9W833_TRYCI|nr:unnamed protein product [Trypanosoma congolense IL3000]
MLPEMANKHVALVGIIRCALCCLASREVIASISEKLPLFRHNTTRSNPMYVRVIRAGFGMCVGQWVDMIPTTENWKTLSHRYSVLSCTCGRSIAIQKNWRGSNAEDAYEQSTGTGSHAKLPSLVYTDPTCAVGCGTPHCIFLSSVTVPGVRKVATSIQAVWWEGHEPLVGCCAMGAYQQRDGYAAVEATRWMAFCVKSQWKA